MLYHSFLTFLIICIVTVCSFSDAAPSKRSRRERKKLLARFQEKTLAPNTQELGSSFAKDDNVLVQLEEAKPVLAPLSEDVPVKLGKVAELHEEKLSNPVKESDRLRSHEKLEQQSIVKNDEIHLREECCHYHLEDISLEDIEPEDSFDEWEIVSTDEDQDILVYESSSNQSDNFSDDEDAVDESDFWAIDYSDAEDSGSDYECDYCGGTCSHEDCCNYPGSD